MKESIALAYESDLHIVKIEDIQYDNLAHSLLIKDTKITLTKTEYRLFYLLRHGYPITYVEMARNTYSCDADEQVRAMIDKHIDRIRSKLRNTGVYIYCVLSYGYLLLNEDPNAKNM
jgi:DNA-binding response OmpR family regulator